MLFLKTGDLKMALQKEVRDITQTELWRAFNLALDDWRSSDTLAFHCAIAKRLNAGAKVEQGGPYTAIAYQRVDGSFGLDVLRSCMVRPGSLGIVVRALIDEQISCFREVCRSTLLSFLQSEDTNLPRRGAAKRGKGQVIFQQDQQWQEGFEAAKSGLIGCPYQAGTVESWSWNSGFVEGQEGRGTYDDPR
jgi:hypothetical protein